MNGRLWRRGKENNLKLFYQYDGCSLFCASKCFHRNERFQSINNRNKTRRSLFKCHYFYVIFDSLRILISHRSLNLSIAKNKIFIYWNRHISKYRIMFVWVSFCVIIFHFVRLPSMPIYPKWIKLYGTYDWVHKSIIFSILFFCEFGKELI